MKKKNSVQRMKKPIRNRTRLGSLIGQEIEFYASVGKKSMTTSGIKQETLELNALYELCDPSHLLLADHIWIKLDDVLNREILDSLISMQTPVTKRIVFTGFVYSYTDPCAYGKVHWMRYSIGNIEVKETHPILPSLD